MQDYRLFPSTRYQGSKRKLLPWLWEHLSRLPFESALDLFGGTGCVSYLLKAQGKQVFFNDALRFNALSATALIANPHTRLEDSDIDPLFVRGADSQNFIETNFKNIYFTDFENKWIDIVTQNIIKIKNIYKRSLAYYCLFQSCIAKRPYNLFHRANLYMRTASVKRSFGNKTTWDKPFPEHFRTFAKEANQAIFDNKKDNQVFCLDALECPVSADLVYIDPPYLNKRSIGVNYLDFYHFLEGLSDYQNWHQYIDKKYKHRPYQKKYSPWLDKSAIDQAFEAIFARFSQSILAVSYRSDGIPSIEELIQMLQRLKKKVTCVEQKNYQYALSKHPSNEVLLIGE